MLYGFSERPPLGQGRGPQHYMPMQRNDEDALTQAIL